MVTEANALAAASAAHTVFFKVIFTVIEFLHRWILILFYFTPYLRFRQALLSNRRRFLQKIHKLHKSGAKRGAPTSLLLPGYAFLRFFRNGRTKNYRPEIYPAALSAADSLGKHNRKNCRTSILLRRPLADIRAPALSIGKPSLPFTAPAIARAQVRKKVPVGKSRFASRPAAESLIALFPSKVKERGLAAPFSHSQIKLI